MRTVFIVALLAAGCVSKKKYDELESLHEASKTSYEQRLAEAQTQLQDKDTTITELERERDGLNTAITKLKEEIAAKEAALVKLRETNANILKDRGALRGEIEAMKEALAELERRKAAADKRIAAFKDLISRFQKLIDAGTLEVKVIDGRMVVSMKTDVLFASGSASLAEEGKTALTEVAGILASLEDRRFQVEGHTDNDPISTEKYPNNWYLASARAIGVVEHMISAGMPVERISAASFGENRPTDTNRTPEGKARNRRIEIVLVPDLSDLPGFDELSANQ